MYICLRIINTCLIDESNHHDSREAFLTINSSDSGHISAEELKNAGLGLSDEEIYQMIENIS